MNTTGLLPRTDLTAPGGSPWVYINTHSLSVRVIPTNNTLTLIEMQTDGVTWDTLGLITGWFLLNPGDAIRLTWVVGTPHLIIQPF